MSNSIIEITSTARPCYTQAGTIPGRTGKMPKSKNDKTNPRSRCAAETASAPKPPHRGLSTTRPIQFPLPGERTPGSDMRGSTNDKTKPIPLATQQGFLHILSCRTISGFLLRCGLHCRVERRRNPKSQPRTSTPSRRFTPFSFLGRRWPCRGGTEGLEK
jgi:hypothetical protein